MIPIQSKHFILLQAKNTSRFFKLVLRIVDCQRRPAGPDNAFVGFSSLDLKDPT